MTKLMRILREPLVHFLLIGSAVFAVFAALDDAPLGSAAQSIVVTDTKAAQLAAGFEAVWRRRPTTRELSGVIADHVREEVYVREALALGLDRDDAVIRRRLRQKMEFLTEAAAGAVDPSEATLRAHYAAHEDRYRSPGRIAFAHIYLGESPKDAEVAEVRAALAAGADPTVLGVRTLLPPGPPLSPREAVDGTFGAGFFEAISGFETGIWSGPTRSGYGLHLVRVDDRVDAAVPPFETVRDAVFRDWTRDTVAEIAEQGYLSLRARYEVTLPAMPAPAGDPQ